MKKLFVYLILGIYFISLISAATLNKPYDLTIPCRGFNCSALNITILWPNSSTLIDNQATTDKNYYAVYTLTPSLRGEYKYYYSDGTNSSYGSFMVTATGNEISNSQALLYILMEIILIFLFLLCLYGGIKIPYKNVRNNEDEVIQVNWSKYLKIFCWAFSYALLLAIIFVMWNLVYGYSQWDNFGTFLFYTFKLLHILGYIVLVALIVLGMVNYITDRKIEAFIKKTGLPFNG